MKRQLNRQFRLSDFLSLDDRITPAVFTATIDPAVDNTGAVNQLMGFFNVANANADNNDTIVLLAGAKYEFNTRSDSADGGTALPILTDINDTFTIQGNGATFYRPPAAPSFRFIRAIGEVSKTKAGESTTDPLAFVPLQGPTLNINNLTFQNGNTFDVRGGFRPFAEGPEDLSGGAIRTDNATVNLNGAKFIGNTSSDNGGAISLQNYSTGFSAVHTIVNSTFDTNYAGGKGGAVYFSHANTLNFIVGNLDVTDSTFANNVSLTGAGAIDATTLSTLDLFNSDIINNRGTVGGTAASTLAATDTFFSKNTAIADGAAAVTATGNQLTLVRTTIADNSSRGSAVVGQGIGRAAELLNTTVTNNVGGSAAVSAPTGQVVLAFSTISNNLNTVSVNAGVSADKNIVDIFATVIAGNKGTQGTDSPDVDIRAEQVRNNGFNFVSVINNTFVIRDDDKVGTKTPRLGVAGAPLDPLLAELKDYGGSVPTRPPAATSPLRDVVPAVEADRVTTDARGQVRLANGKAEIGAFEVQGTDVIGPAVPNFPPIPERTKAVFTATINPSVNPEGAVNEIAGFINLANNNTEQDDTINLFPAGNYVFTRVLSQFDGGTALPLFAALTTEQFFTINGNGAVFSRGVDAPEMRFLRAYGNPGVGKANAGDPAVNLTINNLTFVGGTVTNSGFPALNRETGGASTTETPDLSGGAILLDQGRLITNNVTFRNNLALGDGGAVALTTDFVGTRYGNHEFNTTIFENNLSSKAGGAISNDGGGPVTIRNSTFTGNIAAEGGGAFDVDFLSDGGSLTVIGSKFVNNIGIEAGAISNSEVTVIQSSYFEGNNASGGGAGAVSLSEVSGAALRVEGSTFYLNKALALGGAGAIRATNINLTNTTAIENVGSDAAVVGDSVTMKYSTIVNNVSTFGLGNGGGVSADLVIASNSIIAGNDNTLGDPRSSDIGGASWLRSLGNNFVGVAPTTYDAGAGDQAGTPNAPIDPLLGPLADNGGPVPTISPFVNSPIINKGSASGIATDARGKSRPQGAATDIGAFEVQPSDVLPQPSVFVATINPAIDNAGAVSELIRIFDEANRNKFANDTIFLFPNGKYEFNQAAQFLTPGGQLINQTEDGGTALPIIDNPNNRIILEGRGATFYRPEGAPSFRFIRAIGQLSASSAGESGANAASAFLYRGPTVSIRDLTFLNGNTFDVRAGNRAFPDELENLSGGAIRTDNATLNLTRTKFIGNTSAENGGAVSIQNYGFGFRPTQGRHHFEDVTFQDNYAGREGGAVFISHANSIGTIVGNLEVVNGTFTENISLTGAGAIHGNLLSEVNLLNTDIQRNRGVVGGVSAALVEATGTLFRGNQAIETGASAVTATSNQLTLVNSTIAENSSRGGAVVGQSIGRAVELVNTTITSNVGGAPAVSAPTGEVVITHSTITNNLNKNTPNAGVSADKNIIEIYASVIAGNKGTQGTDSPNVDISSEQVRNNGFNFISVINDTFPVRADDKVGNKTPRLGLPGAPLDPLLAALGEYNGPLLGDSTATTRTRLLTRPPAASSPLFNVVAISNADRLTVDARGQNRKVGLPDIGAFEVQSGDTIGPAVPNFPPPLPRTTATLTATIDPAANPQGAIDEIIRLFNTANNNTEQDDVINLFPRGKYVFNKAFEFLDGGTALPAYIGSDNLLTINGNDATFFRPAGAPSFRFFRAIGELDSKAVGTRPAIGPIVTINALRFEGGNLFDFSTPSRFDGFPLLEGGAIRLDNADVRLNDVQFISNTSTDNGGAVSIRTSLQFAANTQFNRVTFRDNYSGKNGGAVSYVQTDNEGTFFGKFTLTDTIVENNISLTGYGGIEAKLAEAVFNTSKIRFNRGVGGGAYAELIRANGTIFEGNVSTGAGASAAEAGRNMLFLTNSAVINNNSKGGAALIGQGSGLAVELLNSIVHNNTGTDAAVIASQGEVVLSFATVTHNSASTGDAAGVISSKNIITIYSSVIAGNRVTDPLSPNQDLKSDQIRNNGFNFIGVAPTSFGKSATDLVGSPGKELDPRLGPLDNYGGPVPTRLPAPDSPLLNKVTPPLADRITTDGRGLPRIINGAADIGMIELQASDLRVTAQPLPPPLVPPPPVVVPPPPPPLGPSNVIAVGPGTPPPTVVPPPPPPTRGPTEPPLPPAPIPLPPNEVRVFGSDGKVQRTITPFSAAGPGGIRVASADINGDGIPEIIAGTGPGITNRVAVFDGKTGNRLIELQPFEDSFTGGVFVAAGDIDGDRKAEVIITPNDTGGPRVRIFTGTKLTPIADFFGIDDPAFRGGARVAIGDFTGDRKGDIVVAAGPGGGPRVSIWDGAAVLAGNFTTRVVPDFFLFEEGLRNGVFVAAGDVNGDGRADLVAGAGPTGGPRVLVINGAPLVTLNRLEPIADFFAGSAIRRDGVPVSVNDLDSDGLADVVAGGGASPVVNGYLGKNLSPDANVIPDLSFTAFEDFNGGVFVG